jgi:hypothetical protein
MIRDVMAGEITKTMSAERVSVGEDIGPFTDLVAGLGEKGLACEPLPAVPNA